MASAISGDDTGTFDLGVPRQGAYLDELALLGDAIEPLDAVDIDQQFRCGKAHIQRGNQALPTRKQPRVVLVFGKQRHRFLERAHPGVGEWRRLHVSSPSFFLF